MTVWDIIHTAPRSHSELDALLPGGCRAPLCSLPRQEAHLHKPRPLVSRRVWSVGSVSRGRGEMGKEGGREEGKRFTPQTLSLQDSCKPATPTIKSQGSCCPKARTLLPPSSFGPGEGVCMLCPLCDPVGCGPPSPSVLGILQAAILEWVAIS